MANSKYQEWMRQVNEIAGQHGFICCRNKLTWAAYRAGMTAQDYIDHKVRKVA